MYTVGEGGTLITTDVLGIGGTNDDSVLVNDPDLEEDILTAVLDSGPSNASSFSLNSNGTFTYQHNGSETTVDSFDYHANDGEFDSPTVTATINIVPSNDPPIGVDDNYSVLEGGTLNADDADGSVGDATDDGVLANDIDLEGNTLTAALVSGSSNGAPGTSLAPDGTFVYVHDGSETTFDTFTYRPSDIAPGSEATVNITVIPVNDPPVGMADTYTLPEGGTLTADDSIGSVGDSNNDGALANDSDVEGNPFTAVSFTAASNAGPATTFNSDGTFVYQHDGSETNSDSLTYRPQDTDPGIPTAINFIITPVNDAPTVAVNNGLTVAEGSLGNLISSLQLSATDSDDNDPDLVYTITGPPSEGTLFNNGTALTITDNFTQDDINANRLTYSHNDGENPTDSFAFIVIDDETPTPAESSQKFFPITISPDNDPPLGLPDAATLLEGGTFNSALNPLDVPAGGNSILDNDIDPEGDPLSALLISGPANDSAFALAANGTFTYSHNGSETTFDSFTYQPNDVIPGSVTSVSLTIVPQNDPPAAIDDGGAGFITNEDLLFATGDVLNNDSDSDIGDTITVLSFDTSDTMGVVSDNGDGTFFFDPDAQFDFLLPGDITTSTFTYTVEDTAEDTDTATVTITVTGINDQPALNTAQLSLGEGNTVVLNTNNLSASDADHDDSTLIFEASGVVGGQFEFTAAPGTPISTFTQLQISTGAVHFVDDGNEIAPTFDILVRDALNATFGPVPVAINFNFGNDPPTAFDDSSSSFTTNSDFPFTTGNVLANDTDPDPSDILSVQSFNSGATTGLVSDNGDGTFNYDPNGQFDFLLPGQSDSDTFAYTAQDPIGETDDATVTITINGVNDPPVSVADNHTLPEGGSLVAADLNGSVGDSNDDGVLANDSDPEGDAMSALLDSSPTHAASFTLNPNGSFDYSHDGGEDFSDSFTYHATDGSENGDVVIVSLAIQAVNDPPEVVNNAGLTVEMGTSENGIDNTDVDDNDSALIYTVVSAPPNGFIIVNGILVFNGGTFTQGDIDSGLVTYTHNGTPTSSDSFDFTVKDDELPIPGESAQFTFDIAVTEPNAPPTANDDGGSGFSTDEASPILTGNVLSNDTDPNAGDSPTVVGIDTTFTIGSIFDNGDGTFTYDPNTKFDSLQTGQFDIDFFSYTIRDQFGETDTATVTIVVNGLTLVTELSLLRELPENYLPELSILVSLLASPSTGVSGYTVADTVPTGWSVTNISDDGTFDVPSRTVSFSISGDDTRTLTYTATPPAGAAGLQIFTGFGSLEGDPVPVTGDSLIDPIPPQLIETFTESVPTGQANTDPEDDFSQDGLTNLEAYFLGLDPTGNNSGNLPATSIEAEEGDLFIVLNFTRGKFIEGVTFRIQESTDLITFTDVLDAIVQVIGEQGALWFIEARIPADGVNGFVRLLVELDD